MGEAVPLERGAATAPCRAYCPGMRGCVLAGKVTFGDGKRAASGLAGARPQDQGAVVKGRCPE